MKERVKSIKPSPNPKKKYRAEIVGPGTHRHIDFGAVGYEQFRDSTPLHKYASKNHGDAQRRRQYFMRHSGVPGKREALAKERAKSGGKLNARILSHQYLW